MSKFKQINWFIGIILIASLSMFGGCSSSDDSAADMSGGEDWDDSSIPSSNANQGDNFEDVGTNPFVMALYDPFSTFAADVDSASYDIFRRDINNGVLPAPTSVRLEEYVNYFQYDYPAPSDNDAHPFKISLAGGTAIGADTALLRVGIQTRPREEFEQKPANVVFLIDTSGSMMDHTKLGLVQYVLKKTVEILNQGDTVSIVSYAGSTSVHLVPTDVSNTGTIFSVIDSLESGGSTSGAAGIDLAYAQAEAGFKPGGINHVILCTDGDFNVGPSSTEELVDLIVEKRKTGITLTVLGFGTGNLNDAMMEGISNAGNGVYGVISSESHADDYVENKMLSSMQFVAKDVKIQVEFNPEHVKAYRLLGYENRALDDSDFINDVVDAGEIGAGHTVTALYELVLPNGTIPEGKNPPAVEDGTPVEGERDIDAADMVLVKVRYKTVDADEQDESIELRESAGQSILDNSLTQMDPNLRWAAAVAAYAEILKTSPYAREDAMSTIEDIVLEKNWTAKDKAEFADLFSKAKSMF